MPAAGSISRKATWRTPLKICERLVYASYDQGDSRSPLPSYSGFQLSATEIRYLGAQLPLKVMRALGRASRLQLQTTAICYILAIEQNSLCLLDSYPMNV